MTESRECQTPSATTIARIRDQVIAFSSLGSCVIQETTPKIRERNPPNHRADEMAYKILLPSEEPAGISNRKILICGAGIAGPTLAYWLLQWGFEPTLVERAPALRTSGYMIDFSGVGYDVAERMNLLPALSRDAYRIDEGRLVNRRGRVISTVDGQLFQSATKGRFISVLRGDLARHVYSTIEGKIETIFADSIRSIRQDRDGVDVTFERSARRRFDLVLGADGLHSAVRRAAFGEERQFERYLGYCVAAFTVTGYPHRDENVYVGHYMPGRQVWRYSLRDDRTAFTLIFSAPSRPDVAHYDADAYRALLRQAFADAGWEIPAILDAVRECKDLYFDAVSQIRMNRWSQGRVALTGDASLAPSLLSGQGSAFALTGAYLLAGELKAADGDHEIAFGKYQSRFKPFIDAQQEAGCGPSAGMRPRHNSTSGCATRPSA
jgi:2-polyprenyl-6-methoxyphenol hydroxylase-like FAD-dependent oxidoreductase